MTEKTMTTFLHLDRRGLLLAGGAALVLASCAGGGKTPQIYVLHPDLPKNPPGQKVPWELSVATPYAAAGLNIDRVALTRSSTTLDYFADAQWTDRLPILLQSAMMEAFESSGRIDAVSRDTAGLKADYVLETEIRDFTAHYSSGDNAPPTVMIRIAANLVMLPDRTIVSNTEVAQNAPASENTVGAVVNAYNTALTATLKQLVDWTLAAPKAGAAAPAAPGSHHRRRRRRRHTG